MWAPPLDVIPVASPTSPLLAVQERALMGGLKGFYLLPRQEEDRDTLPRGDTAHEQEMALTFLPLSLCFLFQAFSLCL